MALSGKAYNINDLVTYTEERELRYPQTIEEHRKLNRKDDVFDISKAGKLGCPLRWPATQAEYEFANVASNPFNKLLDKEPTGVRDALGTLIYPTCDVPFVFRLPADEETFINKKLPGDYQELVAKFGNNELVTELDSYKVKKVCVLKGIDQSGKCYLVPVDKANSPSDECIIV